METKSRPKYLVALCGLHRTGKDTLATALASTHGFFRVAFSDSLYEEVAESFGVRVSELHSDLWKQNPQDLLSIQCSDSPKYRAMMSLLPPGACGTMTRMGLVGKSAPSAAPACCGAATASDATVSARRMCVVG